MLMAAGTTALWRTARGGLPVDRPVVVAVLNVTPDSFWDGGRHDTVEAAVRHAEALLADGADILDVGGESTRPGAAPVSAHDEARRVTPVVEALVRRFPDVVISVDTVKAEVAAAALDAGAAIINDVSGLRLDPALGSVVADRDAGLILMHSRGGVEEMARYGLAEYSADVAGDVVAELSDARQRARLAGVPDEALVLDPGLGFSKRTEHSIAVLAGIGRIAELGQPVLAGPSRKRFTGDVSGGLPPADRLPATLAACVLALHHGARLFRVHDVAEVRRALDMAWAVMRAGER
jgi:dihydropteroate synthase